MDVSRARWSDLPPELLTDICKRLETYIDVLRCRSVCRSWRASLPPFNAVSPLLPLEAPLLSKFEDEGAWRGRRARREAALNGNAADCPVEVDFLLRKIIYRISPLHHNQTPAKGWFAMVERRRTGKLLFRRPLYFSYRRFSYPHILKEVNLMDFRIQEVAKSYALVSTDGFNKSTIRNVVMFPDSPWTDTKNRTLVAIYEDGRLGFVKLGDTDSKWTKIGKKHYVGGDVIAWRGQFYAVNGRGVVFSIDSSTMKLTKISTPLCGSGIRKHLVECDDKVYVVDQFDRTNIDFKVYNVDLNLELNEKVGRLKEVENLGDKAFVLGERGNFSISETDFEGVRRNCIYYPRSFRGEISCVVDVFDLEERIVTCYADEHVFTPPPMFIDPSVPLDQYGDCDTNSPY